MRSVALLLKEPGSGFGVSFPDLAGCISADEAVRNAAVALASPVALIRADGENVPAPRTIDAMLADTMLAEDLDGATQALAPLIPVRGSSVRINVSIDAGLHEAVDAEAKDRGMTRSGFIASAMRGEILG